MILDGLFEEYDNFITSILSWVDLYTVEEIETLVLSQEEWFEKKMLLNNQLFKLTMSRVLGHLNKIKIID